MEAIVNGDYLIFVFNINRFTFERMLIFKTL
jgi:hypothetical protein